MVSIESLRTMELVLKKVVKIKRDDQPVILRHYCEPGSKAGDNYMSIVKRVEIEYDIRKNQEVRKEAEKQKQQQPTLRQTRSQGSVAASGPVLRKRGESLRELKDVPKTPASTKKESKTKGSAKASGHVGRKRGESLWDLLEVPRITIPTKKELKRKGKTVKLIFKRHIESKSRRKAFRTNEAFANEINAYTMLIPFLIRYGRCKLPFPKCYFAGRMPAYEELIVLEDLRESGYHMVDRTVGLTYDQCRRVMKELANFHAISIAMKAVRPTMFRSMHKKISDTVYCTRAKEHYENFFQTSWRGTLHSLRYTKDKYPSQPWKVQVDAILNLCCRLYDIMSYQVLEIQEPFAVLCHGDVWVNNILFNDEDGSVKLIDLQTMRYTSPVLDIMHLLYSSTRLELRVKYTDQLLKDYHTFLMAALQTLVPEDDKPYVMPSIERNFSLQAIRSDYEKRNIYGLGVAMWLLPAVTFLPDVIPDLDKVSITDFQKKTVDKTIVQVLSQDYHKRMSETVLDFYDRGFLNYPPVDPDILAREDRHE